MNRVFFVLSSLSVLPAVAVGASAAYWLRQKLSPKWHDVFEVGMQYHFYLALGLLVVAFALKHLIGTNMMPAGWLFVAGTILFSGSLYAYNLSSERWLAIIAPIGGHISSLVGCGWRG